MLHSGIAPLDRLGGLIPGRLHLLTGGPGTGKSTACYHFLQAGLQSGDSVALLTLERLSDLLSHTRRTGLHLEAAVRSKQLGLLRFRPDFTRHLSSSASPYRVIDDLWRLIVELKPTRLVIDPLSPFLTDSTASGAALAALAQLLDGFGVTTLLTFGNDISSGYDARLSAIVQHAALVVHLAREAERVLRMQIVQDRTHPAPASSVRFELRDAGLILLPDMLMERVTVDAHLPGFLEIARSS